MPDLCRLRRIAVLLGLAELVVLVVALTPDGVRHWGVGQFLSASGFALWLALAVAGLLCVLRAPLSRPPMQLGALLAVVLAGVTAMLGAGIVHALYAALDQRWMGGGVGFWRFTLGSAGVVTLIVALALRYFYVSDRWEAQLNANARAEADALQARIRPHFLFNSMNLIASLLRRDPAVAERAVLDLSDLFRAALGAGEGDSSLREECELAERYLSIESLRLGDRLQVEWQREEPLPWSLPLPRLTLQPLVENAVLHGISRLPEGGAIVLRLRCHEGLLQVSIRNPAPPPDPQALAVRAGAGHAQRSIAHRLAYRFGPRARMTGHWREGYYACEIALPLT
ncbi:sensor histidine kinase [Xanthomonas sp. AmX2]|uniref:sensor histidine kinase n=1 Tax=Xanthomonas sp. TaxID=29446 RepID=UPI00197F14AF|nr:sensor histidine kinase [Xanthomonas sp.]MBN6150977.1 sensor histidine kinase [Xanthomonas sp.]